ncbi:MAG: cytochrome c [Elusimicrobia bacterium]|nr:cytochrome c [Elusimicrobiota bacterium]
MSREPKGIPISRIGSACLILLALAGCGERERSSPLSPGQAYYQALNCRACHRIGRSGNASGPDLTFVGFRHKREWLDLWLSDPNSWKKDALMPDPDLPEATRTAVVDYLVSLKGQAFAGNKPWDDARLTPAQRGSVIFSRVGCSACHGPGGTGGQPNNNVPGNAIPGLVGVSERYTAGELAQLIIRGKKPEKEKAAGGEPLIEMPAWGRVLSDEEIGWVVDYLLTLKDQDTPTGW